MPETTNNPYPLKRMEDLLQGILEQMTIIAENTTPDEDENNG